MKLADLKVILNTVDEIKAANTSLTMWQAILKNHKRGYALHAEVRVDDEYSSLNVKYIGEKKYENIFVTLFEQDITDIAERRIKYYKELIKTLYEKIGVEDVRETEVRDNTDT